MKKRIFSIILSICMVLMLAPISAKAMKIYVDLSITGEATLTLEVESGDSIDNVKEKIKNQTGYPKEQQILKYNETVLENGRTLADYNIQKEKTLVLSLAVPEGLTYTISGNEVTITDYNGSATEIAIPATIDSKPVTAIGNFAFESCYSLTSINIPAGVTSIGDSAFEHCDSLTSIDIPSSVTSIGHQAFYLCSSLTSIDIPSSVISIGNAAFGGCSVLTSITIPSSVRSIGSGVFNGCTSLKSITIPSSVTSIGAYAFYGCSGLESIFLPDGLVVSNASIRNEATKVRYSLDQTTGEVTITEIELGTGKTSVAIPDMIYGYPVLAVAAGEQSMVGDHTCKGGTATCTAKALCVLCGKEHGDFAHSYTAKTIKTEALKIAGTCQSKAVYYYSCAACGEVEDNDNHTFTGEIDSSKHNLENIPAKAATVTETGNKEYWHCKDCGKYFSDKDGKNSIELADTVIAKLPPEIIYGKGQSVTEGEAKELTFRSNAAFGDFIRVELDGKILDAANYTVKEGSTIVTLKADYMGALSVGEYTIGIVSISGTASATFTVNAKAVVDNNNSPQTGDNSYMVLWITLLFVSGGLFAATGIYSKEKKHSVN